MPKVRLAISADMRNIVVLQPRASSDDTTINYFQMKILIWLGFRGGSLCFFGNRRKAHYREQDKEL
ncbi:hypothetical protein AAG906_006741 [Vitis piasezkii]